MARRRSPDLIAADDAALWRRVTATVAPLPGRPRPPVIAAVGPKSTRSALIQLPAAAAAPASPLRANVPTLDARWDRNLRRGAVIPDRTIDLHDRTLAYAYGLVDRELEAARRDGLRVLLLITGKPRAGVREGGAGARGAIRAQIGDWLAASRHAGAIAAVRPAHPRHGGGGALYVVLRRNKSNPR